MTKLEPVENKKNEQKPHDYGTWGGKKRRGRNPRFISSSKGPLRLGNLAHLDLTAADFGVIVNKTSKTKMTK